MKFTNCSDGKWTPLPFYAISYKVLLVTHVTNITPDSIRLRNHMVARRVNEQRRHRGGSSVLGYYPISVYKGLVSLPLTLTFKEKYCLTCVCFTGCIRDSQGCSGIPQILMLPNTNMVGVGWIYY